MIFSGSNVILDGSEIFVNGHAIDLRMTRQSITVSYKNADGMRKTLALVFN